MSYNDAALWGCGFPQWMMMDGGRDIVTDPDERKRAIARIADLARFKRMFSEIGRYRHEHGRDIHLPNDLWSELQAYRAMIPYSIETSRRKEIERMDDQRKKRKAQRRARLNKTAQERQAVKRVKKLARRGEALRFNPETNGFNEEGMEYLEPDEYDDMYNSWAESEYKTHQREEKSRKRKTAAFNKLFKGFKQTAPYKKILAAVKHLWNESPEDTKPIKRVISSPAKLAELYYKWAAVVSETWANRIARSTDYDELAEELVNGDMWNAESINELKKELADEREVGIDALYL